MRELIDRLRSKLYRDSKNTIGLSTLQLLDGFLYSSNATTSGAPHVRDSMNVQRFLNTFVVASMPCWFVGIWNIGEQTNLAMQVMGIVAAPGWRGGLLELLNVGYDPRSIGACLVHGFLYFLPIFAVALLTGAFWEVLFAQQRNRPVDDGLLAIAWLYTLILPATAPLLQVALGMTFGLVVGKAIFGGSGRYLVSPVILGLGFLVFSYTSLVFAPGAWIPVPGYDEPTTIELFVDEGGVPALLSVNYTWLQLFLGNQPGPIGVTSIFGCLIGAAYLIYTGVASWRIMLGSFIGMVGSVLLFNALGPADNPVFAVPWTWHMVTGGWAFGTVFLATDPVAAANTNPGRWGFGILVGVLTIVVRLTNPSYYEGVIFAILLASIFSPLFDYVVVERNIKRRKRRLEGQS
jgi:Na+-transporting NADH:ubiquinone oxidoreductase subunit B